MADKQAGELIKVEHRDWTDLPSEILSLILSYLFLDDINRFRCICKTWESVPVPWVPSPIRFPVFQSQWLMCVEDNGKGYEFFHPVCNDTYQMKVPELFNAVPRFSKDGWVLMSQGDDGSIFFFNPFTKAKINLPDLPQCYQFKGISFSNPPTSSDCMVFGFYSVSDLHILTICHGEKTWHDWSQIVDSSLSFETTTCNPVFFNGMFYCLGLDSLGVFDPKESGTWTICALPELPYDSKGKNCFLMECDGELIAVFVGFMGTWVSVFRLDNSKMTWREVDNLGDRMLFVSSTTCLSARKIINGMENKIYFPRFHGKYGVFYSLATRRFQTFGKDYCRNCRFQTFGKNYCRKNFYDTEEKLHCSWIVPEEESHSGEELNWMHCNWIVPKEESHSGEELNWMHCSWIVPKEESHSVEELNWLFKSLELKETCMCQSR